MRVLILSSLAAAVVLSACSADFDIDVDGDARPVSRAAFEQAAVATGADVYQSRITARVFDEPLEFDARLILHDDSRFELRYRIADEGDSESDTIEGTYRLDGGSLVLRPRGHDHEIGFRVEEDDLVLKTGWMGTVIHEGLHVPRLKLRRVEI